MCVVLKDEVCNTLHAYLLNPKYWFYMKAGEDLYISLYHGHCSAPSYSQ